MNYIDKNRIRSRERYRNMSPEEKVEYRRKQRQWQNENFVRYRCSLAKARARKEKVSFNLDPLYLERLFIEQDGRCALTGRKMKTNTGESRCSLISDVASIDRIEADGGYVKGNVQWTITGVNYARRNLPLDVFLEICRDVVRFSGP